MLEIVEIYNPCPEKNVRHLQSMFRFVFIVCRATFAMYVAQRVKFFADMWRTFATTTWQKMGL